MISRAHLVLAGIAISVVTSVWWNLEVGGRIGDAPWSATTECLFRFGAGKCGALWYVGLHRTNQMASLFFYIGLAVLIIGVMRVDLVRALGPREIRVAQGHEASEPTPTYDRAKWNALVSYDPEVRSAAEQIQPLGQKWLDELAGAYLALGDKTYLPSIVGTLKKRAMTEDQASGTEQGVPSLDLTHDMILPDPEWLQRHKMYLITAAIMIVVVVALTVLAP